MKSTALSAAHLLGKRDKVDPAAAWHVHFSILAKHGQ